VNLRPYQQQLITDIRLQYQLGKRSVLAVLPTGGGKTVCFSYIAQQAAKKGNRVLVLVHRQELLDQASRAMTVPHGRISAGKAMDLIHAVQVASVQTVARRLHLLPGDFFQLLVVDEAHHTTAGTWSKTIEHFAAAKLLGVTATPIRGDGRGLGEHYQSMVEGPTAAELASEGYLATARVLTPPGFDADGLRKRMGDFDAKQAEQRVGTIMGDCLSHYRKHLPSQTAIAFCCSVAHAEAVARLFISAGIPAASIDGSMDAATRRQLLDDLGTGRLKVLTSCALIGEGVDVPSVGGCILLRPTASVGLHLQMIGRCLRPQAGKTAVVLDHVGNTLRLGHHLEERDWTLDGLKKRNREGAPSVKVCPQCFSTSMSAVTVCPDCGHVFAPQEQRELRVIEGELQELQLRNSLHGSNQRLTSQRKRVLSLFERMGEGSHLSAEDVHQRLLHSEERVSLATVYRTLQLLTSMELLRELDTQQGERLFELAGATRSTKRREQGKATDLDDLRQLAQQRGYKRGWAERVYQARLAKRHGIA
jgi:DNA repair protein RadD